VGLKTPFRVEKENMPTFGSFLRCVAIVVGTTAVAPLFAGPSIRADEPDEPIRALLVIGGCCHDYAAQKDLLTEGISARANVSWVIAYDPDNGTSHLNPVYEHPDWAKGFDVIVHDECCADVKDLKTIERILRPHRDGVPAVLLHCAMHSYRSEGWPDKATPWFEFTGLKTTGHGPQVPIALTIVDPSHPITDGQDNWTTINEELYNNYKGELLDHGHPLMRGKQSFQKQDGTEVVEDCVVTWTNAYAGKTRVFATTLGHNNDTVADARYLDLVTRGLLWSVDKLDAAHLVPAKRVLLDDAKAIGK
jgi:type 1 glutamine amidotransferase